jgi:dual specificity tyrosine-phosphorylation-regulated kinase 2/3/4
MPKSPELTWHASYEASTKPHTRAPRAPCASKSIRSSVATPLRCPRLTLTELTSPHSVREHKQCTSKGTTRRSEHGISCFRNVLQTARPPCLESRILSPKFIPKLPPLSARMRTKQRSKLDTPSDKPRSKNLRRTCNVGINQHMSTSADDSTQGIPATEVMKNMWCRMRKIDREDIMRYKRVWYFPMDKDDKITHEHLTSTMNSSMDSCSSKSHDGVFKIVRGEHVAFQFEVIDSLGQGNFGQVIRCFDHKSKRMVALKVINNNPKFSRQALLEVEVLDRLQGGSSPVVRMLEHFKFRQHTCVVLELLHINLYEFLAARKFTSTPLVSVRYIARQLVEALLYLKRIGIVHCDIKPENILLERPDSLNVKLIDFGSACYAGRAVYTYVQSRFYRAPEVMLGIGYSHPIDMWSLACVLAELYIGEPIFFGDNEAALLSSIVSKLGPPPKRVLLAATNTERRVNFTIMSTSSLLECSESRMRNVRVGTPRRLSNVSVKHRSLRCRPITSKDSGFDEFLNRALDWDPARRLTPEAAIRHVFLKTSPEQQ